MHLFKTMQSSFLHWTHLLDTPYKFFWWSLEVGCKKECCLPLVSSFQSNQCLYLTVLACYQACPVHTIMLNFKDPFVFYTPAIERQKAYMHFPPYMLPNSFWMASCHFLHDLGLGWFQASLNVWISSSSLVSSATIAIVAKPINNLNFLLPFFWATPLKT